MSETTNQVSANVDIDALPEKMRAHAAAKALGLTSKEFITALAAHGVEVKSAQSGVTRDQIALLVDGRDAGAARGAEESAPAPKKRARKAAKKAAPKAAAAETAASDAPDTADAAAGEQGEPAKKTAKKSAAKKTAKKAATKSAAKKSTAKKSAAQAADATGEADAGTEAGSVEADAASASANRPALPEISIVTGEVGAAEERGRGSRGGRGRRRAQPVPEFSPLFMTPGEATDQDAGVSVITITSDSSTDDEDTQGKGQGQDRQSGSDDSENTGGGRRRRRGRRGRGRGRGDGEGADSGNQNAEDSSSNGDKGSQNDKNFQQDSEQSGDSESKGSDGKGSQSGTDSDSSSEGESRHRRRRRRRKGSSDSGSGSGSGHDDPPNTEVHERPARRRGQSAGTGDDEVRGISGSTRLEAKRRRRQPGGTTGGRRRQAILSESEFLARREAVERVMVVRERKRHDSGDILTQVGVLEDKVLVEHFVTTEAQRSMVGNIYLGRVQNVLPSMEAAFIDIGRGRNGVLYAGEVNWEAAGLGGKARRIEQALKPGDSVLVQVTKDPVGQKGARLSTQISLAGRFLVFVPEGNSTGISRKLPDTERRRLKSILKEVVPQGNGVIIRTAAEGVSEDDIRRDVDRLAKKWEKISEQAEKAKSGKSGQVKTLYEEPDLLVKVVRDLFNEDFSKLIVQGEKSWNTVHDYVTELAPEMEDRLERYTNDEVDVFAVHRIDEQLHKALERTVWLPSGGTLVIDRTEAMTVIDVNTGKFTGSGGNLEETVTRNNLEAAEEIVRQLRLRDIGGMVIVDFIDMVLESNRDLVVRRLTEALGRDRTRHQVSEVTSLGLVQITRKRLGTGLVEAFSSKCECCGGRGIILHEDPVTVSPTSDDGGSGRKRRRRGGNGGGSGAEQHHEKKDGPAPSAHPMMLAMQHHKDDDDHVADEAQAAAAGKATDDKQAETAKPVEQATSTDSAAAEATDEAGADKPRRRSRRRVTRAAAAPAAEAGEQETKAQPAKAAAPQQDAPADTAPAADPEVAAAAGIAAAPVAASAPAEDKPRRRGRRTVTRQAGASDPAPQAQSETPGGESAAPVAAEFADERIVALDAETAAAPDAASLAVNKKTERRTRRTVRRPSGTS